MTAKRICTVLLLFAALGAGASPAWAAEPPPPSDPATARANELMAMSAADFVAADKGGFGFELSSDGCSNPTALGIRFQDDTCVQHDFGYRNYGNRFGKGLSPTRATKDWIDQRFQEEMLRACEEYVGSPGPSQECVDEANAVFYAVSTRGDDSFF